MSKKLLLSGLAIAMALPAVASATEVTFSGVVQTKYFVSNDAVTATNDDSVAAGDVRLGVKASETVDGLTGYVTYRVDADGLNGTGLTADDVTAGISGDFGEFKLGGVSDVEFGEYANDISADGETGSGQALGYTGSFGGFSVGALYSPESQDDATAFGAAYTIDVVTLGASFGDVAGVDRQVLGAKADIGSVTLAAHAWEQGTTEGTAIKVSGSVSAWSWGVTFDDRDQGTETTRLDLGTSLAGLDLGIRYNSEEAVGGASTDSLYLQLGKSF